MKVILTIDDNNQVHKVLQPMLEIWMKRNTLTLDIIALKNGAEALAWVEKNGAPYMALLDVRMPIMGGAEFLHQTTSLGYDFRPFTLLLTGYADDLEEHLGTDALLMKHLRKPFKLKELTCALDKLLVTTLSAEPR